MRRWRRWLHWQFAVPRVLLAIVALLGAQYVLGVVTRSTVIRSSEDIVGARIELGHARVSLLDRGLVFNGVRLADRLRPSEDILTADFCVLSFAAEPFLHKRVVVESGQLSGVQFGAFADRDVATPNRWFKDDIDLAARTWLEHLGEQFSLDVVKQFDSVERTEAFCANWSKQSAALESWFQELDARAAELQVIVEAAQANPLRNDKLLADLRKKVSGLQKEFADFRAEVEKLPDMLEIERRAIVAARRHDDEVVGKRLSLEPVDTDALTAYLLRDVTAKQLDQLVGCLRSMRGVAVDGDKPPFGRELRTVEPRAIGRRGESILFAGCRKEPEVLIKSLQLDGTARIGGQPLEFRGELTDLASEPRLHNRPIRLHLVGNGSLPLQLQATIDRTDGAMHDELLVDCQSVLLPGVALGRRDELEMKLAPSVGSLSVSVVVDGDKLSGDVQMVQHHVQISPALNASSVATLSSGLEESLGRLNSIATRVSLSGTLDAPTCTLWSNLGAAVAEALKQGVNRVGDGRARELLVEAGRRVDERLAEVDRQISEKQTRFASKTTDITAQLQKIAAKESPRYRISAEQGGRVLPNNSLFR